MNLLITLYTIAEDCITSKASIIVRPLTRAFIRCIIHSGHKSALLNKGKGLESKYSERKGEERNLADI